MENNNPASNVPVGPDTDMPRETADAIRRYMEIQKEMRVLEQEKEQLRNAIVQSLGDTVPTLWRPTLDGRPLVVVHENRTTVHYDEETLQTRLGDAFSQILEIDGTKIRKNRDLVRPLLASVLPTVGTVTAARVEAAIKSGVVKPESFRGAFQKTVTPYVSIRVDTRPS